MRLFKKSCKNFLIESLNKFLIEHSKDDIEKDFINLMQKLSKDIYLNISGNEEEIIFDNATTKKKDLLNITKLPESSIIDFESLDEDKLEHNFRDLIKENERKNMNVKIFWSGYVEGSQRTAGLLAYYLENNLGITARIIETTDLPKKWLNICGTWDYEGERLNKAIHKIYSKFEDKFDLLFNLSYKYANGVLLEQINEIQQIIDSYSAGGFFSKGKNKQNNSNIASENFINIVRKNIWDYISKKYAEFTSKDKDTYSIIILPKDFSNDWDIFIYKTLYSIEIKNMNCKKYCILFFEIDNGKVKLYKRFDDEIEKFFELDYSNDSKIQFNDFIKYENQENNIIKELDIFKPEKSDDIEDFDNKRRKGMRRLSAILIPEQFIDNRTSSVDNGTSSVDNRTSSVDNGTLSFAYGKFKKKRRTIKDKIIKKMKSTKKRIIKKMRSTKKKIIKKIRSRKKNYRNKV